MDRGGTLPHSLSLPIQAQQKVGNYKLTIYIKYKTMGRIGAYVRFMVEVTSGQHSTHKINRTGPIKTTTERIEIQQIWRQIIIKKIILYVQIKNWLFTHRHIHTRTYSHTYTKRFPHFGGHQKRTPIFLKFHRNNLNCSHHILTKKFSLYYFNFGLTLNRRKFMLDTPRFCA